MLIDAVKGLGVMFPVLLVAATLQGCGSSVELASNWSNSAVVIDGKADEWSSSLMPIKDSPVMLGMRNDQDYLYLCLKSSDRQLRQQMMVAGMIVWFEPKGGDQIGIHYPLGMTGGIPSGIGPAEGGLPGDEPPFGGPPDAGPPEQGFGEGRNGIMPELVKELEVLGPGKNDVKRMSLLETPGIEVGLGQSGGILVYELKIPLKKSEKHPYALASSPGSTVDVNFETGKLTRPSGLSGGMPGGGGGPRGGGPGGMGPGGGGPGGGGPPSGGMPGDMGGGRRGRGSGPGGGRTEPKQFKFEAEATLASGSANSATK
jgi:hypothetical protein